MNRLLPPVIERLAAESTRLLAAGHAAQALPMLRVLADEDAGGHLLLGEALLRLEDGPGALAAAEASLRHAPEDAAALLLRAQARRLCREPEAALDDACRAVQARPGDAMGRRVLATLLSETGRHDEALFLFWGLLQQDAGAARARIDMALALSRAGRFAAAEELYALVAGEAVETRGLGAPRTRNLLSAGDPARALEVADAALDSEGPSGALHASRGQALLLLGRAEEARDALRQALRLSPEDAFAAHLSAALEGGAEDSQHAYARDLFDGYADRFEASLLALGYRAPGLLRFALEELRPGLRDGSARLGPVLDLGCGTGLAGVAVSDRLGGPLVGVDLSPRMLAVARAKRLYTDLVEAEACAFLAGESRAFDVVLAADVFVYFRDLGRVLAAIGARLAEGGVLAFTCEAAGGPGGIGGNGRFRHDEAEIRAALAAAGLVPRILRPEALRLEAGAPVPGWLVAAERAG
ncbi:methyltransferase domain-containing protein [Roseococcus sp. DSY-14]|uniref:methyltransferase domain-containing protein n=1 Tax=Roseococcus sp. DSY-14 TaxID=3369650 RepID=UPI00387B0390